MKFFFLYNSFFSISLFICKSTYFSALEKIMDFSKDYSKNSLAVGLLLSAVTWFLIRGKKKSKKIRYRKFSHKLKRRGNSFDGDYDTTMVILCGVGLLLLIIAIIIWFRIFLWIVGIAGALWLIYLTIKNWESWGKILSIILGSLGLVVGLIYLIAFLSSTIAVWGPWALALLGITLVRFLFFSKKATEKRIEGRAKRKADREAKKERDRIEKEEKDRKAREEKDKSNSHDNE